MATDLKASRVAILSLALTGATALVIYLVALQQNLPPAAAPVTCTSLPANIKTIGPALTIAQVEAQSLAEIQSASPGVPRVPFGQSNSEWIALKHLMRPGDTVHEFRTEVMGGHLVLRQECFIGQIVGWVR